MSEPASTIFTRQRQDTLLDAIHPGRSTLAVHCLQLPTQTRQGERTRPVSHHAAASRGERRRHARWRQHRIRDDPDSIERVADVRQDAPRRRMARVPFRAAGADAASRGPRRDERAIAAAPLHARDRHGAEHLSDRGTARPDMHDAGAHRAAGRFDREALRAWKRRLPRAPVSTALRNDADRLSSGTSGCRPTRGLSRRCMRRAAAAFDGRRLQPVVRTGFVRGRIRSITVGGHPRGQWTTAASRVDHGSGLR